MGNWSKVLGVTALLLASACGAPEDNGSWEEQAITRPGPSLTPTVLTAVGHVLTTDRLRDMNTCVAKGTPLPNAGPPARPPFGRDFLSRPLASFEGTANEDNDQPNSCGAKSAATDDSGVIGRRHFVQTTNFAISVYDRAGHLLAGPVNTTTFFDVNPLCVGGWSDVTVAYDRHADRWLIQRLISFPPNSQCIAISHTPDPTGTYDIYAFDVTPGFMAPFGNGHDFPKLAVWSDGYYATSVEKGFENNVGNLAMAFERDAMIRGDAAPRVVTFLIPPAPLPSVPPGEGPGSHALPADLDGATLPPRGTPNPFVQLQDDTRGFPADRLQVWEFHADWRHPLASTMRPTASLPTSFSDPVQDGLRQPGDLSAPSFPRAETKGLNFRLAYRTFGDHESMVVSHTNAAGPAHDLAGIQWYEIRRERHRPWRIFQEGTYAPDDGNNRILGPVAMDRDGNIAMQFNVIGPTAFQSIHYAGRLSTDPRGTMPRGELTLIDGQGATTADRSAGDFRSPGDYSELSVDPLDDCTFWATNTYIPRATATNEWHTRIGAFKFTSCGRFHR